MNYEKELKSVYQEIAELKKLMLTVGPKPIEEKPVATARPSNNDAVLVDFNNKLNEFKAKLSKVDAKLFEHLGIVDESVEINHKLFSSGDVPVWDGKKFVATRHNPESFLEGLQDGLIVVKGKKVFSASPETLFGLKTKFDDASCGPLMAKGGSVFASPSLKEVEVRNDILISPAPEPVKYGGIFVSHIVMASHGTHSPNADDRIMMLIRHGDVITEVPVKPRAGIMYASTLDFHVDSIELRSESVTGTASVIIRTLEFKH